MYVCVYIYISMCVYICIFLSVSIFGKVHMELLGKPPYKNIRNTKKSRII